MRTINFISSAALVVAALFFSSTPSTNAERAWGRAFTYQTQSTNSDYRNDNYLDDIASDGIYRWLPEKLPVKVYIENGANVPGYRSTFRQALTQSFDRWSQLSAGRLGWTEVRDKSRADIVCSWTDQATENDRGTEIGRTKTFTRFDTSTNSGTIQRATMVLLTEMPDRDLSDYEVEKAYLHEVGHAFGLAGHSPVRSDIMAAAINDSQRLDLSRRDINTINRLYSGYEPITTAIHPVNDVRRL